MNQKHLRETQNYTEQLKTKDNEVTQLVNSSKVNKNY